MDPFQGEIDAPAGTSLTEAGFLAYCRRAFRLGVPDANELLRQGQDAVAVPQQLARPAEKSDRQKENERKLLDELLECLHHPSNLLPGVGGTV